MEKSSQGWVPVHGWEEDYAIHPDGKVMSVGRLERTLKPTVMKGRLFVTLAYRNEQGSLSRRVFSLPLLVAEHFLPAPPAGKRLLAFKDGNKLNARADNLYWKERQPLPPRVVSRLNAVLREPVKEAPRQPSSSDEDESFVPLRELPVNRHDLFRGLDDPKDAPAQLPRVTAEDLSAIMREFGGDEPDEKDESLSNPAQHAKEPVWARWGSEAAMHAAFMAGEGLVGPEDMDLTPEEQAQLDARRREVEARETRGPGRPRKDSRQD